MVIIATLASFQGSKTNERIIEKTLYVVFSTYHLWCLYAKELNQNRRCSLCNAGRAGAQKQRGKMQFFIQVQVHM